MSKGATEVFLIYSVNASIFRNAWSIFACLKSSYFDDSGNRCWTLDMSVQIKGSLLVPPKGRIIDLKGGNPEQWARN